MRSQSRQSDVETMLRTAQAPDAAGVRYFQADLTADAGWAAAVAGTDYVLHVASPFPGVAPKDEDETIVPARVVLTSSFAAVGYGHGKTSRVFDERDCSS
jgi:dihydroflavonol-4-reductase